MCFLLVRIFTDEPSKVSCKRTSLDVKIKKKKEGGDDTQKFEDSSGLVHFIAQRQHGDA